MPSPRSKDTIAYETSPDDTLWGLCERFYGDADLWSRLGQINRIGDPNGLGRVRLGLPRELSGKTINLDELAGPAHKFDLSRLPVHRISCLIYEVVLGWDGTLNVRGFPRSRGGAPEADRATAERRLVDVLGDVSVEYRPDRLEVSISCELIRRAREQGADWELDEVRERESGVAFEKRPQFLLVQTQRWIIDGTLGCLGGARLIQKSERPGRRAHDGGPVWQGRPTAR